MKCCICGEEIKDTDREAVAVQIFKLNKDEFSGGYICGECVLNEEIYKLWRAK